jgi:multiple antibiotic resistance protein
MLSIALLLFIVLDPFGNMVTLNTLLGGCPPHAPASDVPREPDCARDLLLFVFAGGGPLPCAGARYLYTRHLRRHRLFMIALGMCSRRDAWWTSRR